MDKKIFFILLFIAATGLCTGAFFEVFMSGEGKDQLAAVLTGFFDPAGSDTNTVTNAVTDASADAGANAALGPLTAFWQSFRGPFLFLILCFVSPVVFVLLPICALYLFFHGLFMGFSATMLIEAMGLRGLVYTTLTLLPSGLLQVLLFAFLLMVSLKQGGHILETLRNRRGACGRKNRNALQCFTGQYIRIYLVGLAVLFSICLLKVFLLQVVL